MGRVTEQLLLAHCAEVDLIEPSAHLLDAARARLPGASSSGGGGACSNGGGGCRDGSGGAAPCHPPGHHAAGFFQMGLQAFTPAPERCPHACVPSAEGFEIRCAAD